VELLEAVPGTLFLKNLHPVRHLAIPEELLESVSGTDGSCGTFGIRACAPDHSGAFPSELQTKQQLGSWA